MLSFTSPTLEWKGTGISTALNPLLNDSISTNSLKVGEGGLTITYTDLCIKGTLRYNNNNNLLEIYDGTDWNNAVTESP